MVFEALGTDGSHNVVCGCGSCSPSLWVWPVIVTRHLLHHPLIFRLVLLFSTQDSDPCLAVKHTDTVDAGAPLRA